MSVIPITRPWPNKKGSEAEELKMFRKGYLLLPHGRTFSVVRKRERPDYLLRDEHSGKHFGLELTSAYIDERSVPDVHKCCFGEVQHIEDDEALITRYFMRIKDAIARKTEKAKKGYELIDPLILSIYTNEYLVILLDRKDFEDFVMTHLSAKYIEPFHEIVFVHNSGDTIFSARLGDNNELLFS